MRNKVHMYSLVKTITDVLNTEMILGVLLERVTLLMPCHQTKCSDQCSILDIYFYSVCLSITRSDIMILYYDEHIDDGVSW